MSTGLPVFDGSVQDTNGWLKDVAAHLGDADRQAAHAALRTVLHALRDRLQAQAAVNFADQLPMPMRGLYYEGWTLPEAPTSARNAAEFADTIAADLPPRSRCDPLLAARAVFATAAKYMSEGEATKVKRRLPEGLREPWPSLAHD